MYELAAAVWINWCEYPSSQGDLCAGGNNIGNLDFTCICFWLNPNHHLVAIRKQMTLLSASSGDSCGELLLKHLKWCGVCWKVTRGNILCFYRVFVKLARSWLRCDKCPLLFVQFLHISISKGSGIVQTIPARISLFSPPNALNGGEGVKRVPKTWEAGQVVFLERWRKISTDTHNLYFNSNDIFDCIHLDENMYEVTIIDHTIIKYMYLFKNYSKYMNHS